MKSFQSEKEEAPLEESIQVLETLEDEDLAEEEVEGNGALKAVKKQQDILNWRITLEMYKASDPSGNPEQKEEAEDKVLQLKETYAKIVEEEREFQKKLGIYQVSLQQEIETLEKERADLERANEEDRKIIINKNTSAYDRTSAEERVEQCEREREMVDTRLEETGQDTRLEQDIPLLEKIKGIFKKYGVTVTAIFLAAGVTTGVVVGSVTKALKATGKALENGLEAIGAKVASLLHGLIGAIVSCLFKMAGQVISYLAEHTWLLIFVAVVFIVEKYIKNRC